MAAAAPALAAGANELQVALRAGIGGLNVANRPWGPVGGLDVEYGLTDGWALRGSLEGSTHAVSRRQGGGIKAGTEHTGAALVGITYTVDMLRLVPVRRAAVRCRPDRAARSAPPMTMFVSELGLGGDYYATRRLRVGLCFQYLYRPQDLFQNPEGFGNAPFMFSMTARVSWVF